MRGPQDLGLGLRVTLRQNAKVAHGARMNRTVSQFHSRSRWQEVPVSSLATAPRRPGQYSSGDVLFPLVSNIDSQRI